MAERLEQATADPKCKHPKKYWHNHFMGAVNCGKCGWIGLPGRKGMIWNKPRPL